MAGECKEFKGHQLRPNKCKNCFGDKLQHNQQQASGNEEAGSYNQLQLDRLAAELKKCHEERTATSEENGRLQQQIDQLKMELASSREASQSSPPDDRKQLLDELDKTRQEREKAREELSLLQHEMEEMHDNFKEEESEQFEQVKQELDMAMKNCKILQIRLNKAERQYAQLEQVKSMLERQLADCVTSSPNQPRPNINDEDDGLKGSINLGEGYSTGSSRIVRLSATKYDQLLKELNDMSERERDLQEQIKFSQEEAQAKHERLQMLEVENELLMSNLARRSSMDSVSSENFADQQLKLALEMANGECQRLQQRRKELAAELESKELHLRECTKARERLESELATARALSNANGLSSVDQRRPDIEQMGRLELECRQLRTRLIEREREIKQLRAQLEQVAVSLVDQNKSDGELAAKHKARVDQLSAQNAELTRKLEQLAHSGSKIESDLIGGLKKRLESSESELVRARARLVELDLECSKARRQHKRLIESLATSSGDLQICKRVKLPEESQRDAMSRQELRAALRSLEQELAELSKLVGSKDCLIRELRGSVSPVPQMTSGNESTANLRKLLDQERNVGEQLRRDVASLEETCKELQSNLRSIEGERANLMVETERLQQVNKELRVGLDNAKEEQERRLRDAQASCDKLRVEALQKQSSQSSGQMTIVDGAQSDVLLIGRDLSELRAKNSFLVRELELARDEAKRQVEEVKKSQEALQRRSIEMALVELKDKHLSELQVLRDELNELRQRLATAQRQTARADEETANERERVRTLERDLRRDKSQWNQRIEHLEAQLAIERRSAEFRVKEVEASVREKERLLLNTQESFVQQERDFKRLQNKHRLLEDESESRIRELARELDSKKRQLNDMLKSGQTREEQQHELVKRLNSERATLTAALESTRRSYEQKMTAARQLGQQLQARQEQAFRERLQSEQRLKSLESELIEANERELEAKLKCQQLEVRERQLETMRREGAQLRETISKFRAKCEELERRCQQYERRELAARASSISPLAAASSLLRSARQSKPNAESNRAAEPPIVSATTATQVPSVADKLTGKVNDQRQMINLLRQQLEEGQLELRQVQLMRTAEKANGEARSALLRSRLAECEERLAFESAGQLSSDAASPIRHQLEVNWTEERKSMLETIKQQQLRCEQLVRDLKKLGQTHELLRHQTRQLQTNNEKLSRKLIELQQIGRSPIGCSSTCMDLRDRNEKLAKELERLQRLVREQAKPLSSTLGKIMSALDATERSEPKSVAGGDTPISSGYATESGRTVRPPLTPQGSESSDVAVPTVVRPNDAEKNSRLSRFLGRDKTTPSSATSDKTTTRTVRRVRIKSSALGISATERKQLKVHLQRLIAGLAEMNSPDTPISSSTSAQLHSRIADDSDLDSEMSGSTIDKHLMARSSDRYQRFPLSKPAGYVASLTDYDSDLSLASRTAGAESDAGGQHASTTRKKRGLKTRFTSTLRNLSRSITGLTSDSEVEQVNQSTTRRMRPNQMPKADSDLHEIRV